MESSFRTADGHPPAVKPLLFLDVDGVVLPLGAGRPQGYEEARAGPFKVCVSPILRAELAGLLELFDMVWATSWCEEANAEVGPLLNLPRLPALPVERHSQKLALVRDRAGERPFAWAEDRLEPEARRWAETRPASRLLVAPQPELGLTGEDIERLRQFGLRIARCGSRPRSSRSSRA